VSNIEPQEIFSIVCRVYRVNPEDLRKRLPRRGGWGIAAEARYCTAFLIMTHTGASMADISRLFGLRPCKDANTRFRANAEKFRELSETDMITRFLRQVVEDEIDLIHESRLPALPPVTKGFEGLSRDWAGFRGSRGGAPIHFG
jgi:hypothetical protein